MATLPTFNCQSEPAITTTWTEIHRIKELAQRELINLWVGTFFTRITERMVQQIHQSVSRFPLGTVPLSVFRM
jgi:predicted RecB family nuclease